MIPEKLYFKIGEVCDLVGVQAHVLRYWETEFPQLSPQKNRSGQRSYRRRDVEISLRIKELLYDEMYTIAGARKKLQNELREPPKLKIVHPDPRTGDQADVIQDPPGLFDGDLTLEEDTAPVADHARSLSADQKEALRDLSIHLMELRELLEKRSS